MMDQRKIEKNKFKTFIKLAQVMNKYGIIPIVFGSLGLYRIIEQQDEINDIDIVLQTLC